VQTLEPIAATPPRRTIIIGPPPGWRRRDATGAIRRRRYLSPRRDPAHGCRFCGGRLQLDSGGLQITGVRLCPLP